MILLWVGLGVVLGWLLRGLEEYWLERREHEWHMKKLRRLQT